MSVLFLGDVVGRPGRKALAEQARNLRRDLELDVLMANVENASGGIGLNAKAARELLALPLDVLTGGNHTWKHKDVFPVFQEAPRLLRPANYPAGAPGTGLRVFETAGGVPYAVLNLLGRTYMDAVDCPFQTARTLLDSLPADVAVRIVDFHAEATSEKKGMAYFLDGRVSAVLGTHTHVQTNDARILPGGTAALTDVGMCGPVHSVIGMDAQGIVNRFLTRLPVRFEVAKGPARLEGALCAIDESTGRALSIRPWQGGLS
ncbi:TIGR00282 family metallophosphoesterase [Fundidesulfovibrio magnetotacticus]|uniref:TIGR00282 family metallophosphoesterase n=1 Tax=Fundidesulfovibrio magnetotacticus TaxID=2730080 RepID=UPI0015671C8F|nr:TIGR00282 family metallophosphoesterase [Fundidesulfovibrio magnetotacticus]